MIYKLQLWFTKRYRPKFLDLYMMKDNTGDNDEIFATIHLKSGDFAPIIHVIHDMFFNFFEFREHIKKMYWGEFKQDEIDTLYNNLFDKIVKHIARKEADEKIIEEANKMLYDKDKESKNNMLGNHKQLQKEAKDRDLISPISYQLMPNPVTLKTIDFNEREYNEEEYFYDRSQLLKLQFSPMTRRKILVGIDNQEKRREIAEFAKRVIQQNKKQQQIKTLLRDLKNLISELSKRNLTDDHKKEIDSILKQKTEKNAMFKIGKSPAFGTKYPNFDSFRKSQNRKKSNQQK